MAEDFVSPGFARRLLGRTSALPSYSPRPTTQVLEASPREDYGALALEAAQAGALGGAVGGGSARGFGVANEMELERLNREFMIDRAKRRARRGLGGTTLDDVGPNLAYHLTEEGRLRGGLGKYVPYGDDFPYSTRERFGLGAEAYSMQEPVTLKDGSRLFVENSDLMSPDWMRYEEEILAKNPAIRPPVESVPGRSIPAADTRIGATVKTVDGIPFTKAGPNTWMDSAGDMMMTDALIDESLPEPFERDPASKFLSSREFEPSSSSVPPVRRGGIRTRDMEDLEYLFNASEKLKTAQLSPHFSGTVEGTLPGRGPEDQVRWFPNVPVSDIDLQKSGISRELLDIDRPTNWVKDRSDRSFAATKARDVLGPLADLGPSFANEAPVPSKMSRLGSALKSGIKGALSPVSILTDATLGAGVGAGSALLGYELARPRSAGLFTPQNPRYEGVADPAMMERISERGEAENELERQKLIRQYNALGYDIDPNTRLRDLRR